MRDFMTAALAASEELNEMGVTTASALTSSAQVVVFQCFRISASENMGFKRALSMRYVPGCRRSRNTPH